MKATTSLISSWLIQGKKRLRFAPSAAGNIGITLTVVLIWNVILQGYLSPFSRHAYERRISFASSNAKTSSTSSSPHSNSIFPDENDPYLKIMVQDERLVRSAQHQSKFLALRKNISLPYFFPRELLFPTTTGRAAAFIINNNFAYVHVWKSGGTTIENQLHKPQVAIDDIQNHTQWISFVRDPIDHFLSGYSECQVRHYAKNHGQPPAWDEGDYDRRIREWLSKVQSKTQIFVNMCTLHSVPQVNFFIDPTRRKFYPKIKAIGDMAELPAFLERIADFAYNYSLPSSNVASDNRFKMQYFPARRDLLSNTTLQAICRFVSLDYHFFNFQPPDVCRPVLVTPKPRPLPLKAGEHYELPKAVQPRILVSPRPQTTAAVLGGRAITVPAATNQHPLYQTTQAKKAETLLGGNKYNKQVTTVHPLLQQQRRQDKRLANPDSLH